MQAAVGRAYWTVRPLRSSRQRDPVKTVFAMRKPSTSQYSFSLNALFHKGKSYD
jgi:hypothetical protein